MARTHEDYVHVMLAVSGNLPSFLFWEITVITKGNIDIIHGFR